MTSRTAFTPVRRRTCYHELTNSFQPARASATRGLTPPRYSVVKSALVPLGGKQLLEVVDGPVVHTVVFEQFVLDLAQRERAPIGRPARGQHLGVFDRVLVPHMVRGWTPHMVADANRSTSRVGEKSIGVSLARQA